MTGLFSPTTRKPLAVLLSVLCLASAGGAAASLALDVPPATASLSEEEFEYV